MSRPVIELSGYENMPAYALISGFKKSGYRGVWISCHRVIEIWLLML